MEIRLVLFYSGQFWTGVIECEEAGSVKALRHIFGSEEPSDPEVLAFVLQSVPHALDGIRPVPLGEAAREAPPLRANPKRLARMAAREVTRSGPSSRAQEAMKAELETRKVERKAKSRAEREAEAERRRQLRVQKRKEKHRGH